MSRRKKRKNVKNSNKVGVKNTFSFALLLLLLIVLLIFLFSKFINQQSVLSQQDKDLKYYAQQKQQLKEEKQQLKNQLSKIDSEEYIESVAREKLNLFYPNEKLYVDASSNY